MSLSGSLTVGEATRHLGRSQSVVSDIFEGLLAKGLVERMHDPSDRRRVLVWLSDEGIALLERDRDVLSRPLLERAMVKT